MTDLTITHTDLDGTLIEGTTRGDGTAEHLKTNGWRWSRTLGAWYIPRSRGVPPKRRIIDATRDALTAAGFTVALYVDATPTDRAALEADRTERDAARAERYEAKADRKQAESDARHAAAKGISDGIPFGQPILAGHHSQARAERDRDRIIANHRASYEAQKEADEARHRAASAAAAAGHRNNPVTIGNRIARLEAEARGHERMIQHLHDSGADHTAFYVETVEKDEATRADLDYWRKVRDEQVASGAVEAYGPDTVNVGDAVRIGGGWHRVARVNKKSVSVETGYSWTDRAPWHKVTGHRPANTNGAGS